MARHFANFHLLFVLLAFTHFCSYFSEIRADVKPVAHEDSAATSHPDRSSAASSIVKDKSGGEAKALKDEHKVTHGPLQPDEHEPHDKYDKFERQKATPSPLQHLNHDGGYDEEETMDEARRLHPELESADTGKLHVTPNGKIHDSVNQLYVTPNGKANKLHAAESKSKNGNGGGKADEVEHGNKLGDKAAAKSRTGEGAEEEIMDEITNEFGTESGIVKQGGEPKHAHGVQPLLKTAEEGDANTATTAGSEDQNANKTQDYAVDGRGRPSQIGDDQPGEAAQVADEEPTTTGGVSKASARSTTVIYVFVIICIVLYIDKLDLYA